MQKLIFSNICSWCWANQNNRIRIFTRPPEIQTCWLGPCLFVCMYCASSVIRHPVLKHWMLKQLSPANLWLSWKQKIGAENLHLHLCQPVKSNPYRQNKCCQALTWRAILHAHAKVCQELISLPVLQQHYGVPSCFYSLSLMRGGHSAVPLPFSPK